MIEPTIGRQVWYHGSADDKHLYKYGEQPMAATVVFVQDSRRVNLSVLDHAGLQHVYPGVPLLQDDDLIPNTGHYCQWMPYQKAVASGAIQPALHATGKSS